MLLSTMLTEARKLANDTDTSDPFHSDALVYGFFSDWQVDLAIELRYPRKQQTISFAVNDGGATGTKNLDNDILSVVGVLAEPTSGTGQRSLFPKTEASMALVDPAWRALSAATPSYYIIQDALTAQAQAMGPLRTITTERPTDAAFTMRIYGVQNPIAVSAGTNSPIFPIQFHITGAYYAAWMMLLPRDAARADYYRKLYDSEVRRKRGQWTESSDPSASVWDVVEAD